MRLSLIDDLKPHSKIIMDIYDSLLDIRQCADRLKQSGFPFYAAIDLLDGSDFLESIKSIMLEQAWNDNEEVKSQELVISFLPIAFGMEKPDRKILVTLIVALDSTMNKSPKITKDFLKGLTIVLERFQSDWPNFLSWLPFKYLEYIDKNYKISLKSAP